MNLPSREFLRKIILVALFLTTPVFFALFGSRIMFGEVENAWKEGFEKRLGEILGEVESDKDPIKSFSRFFRRVEKRAFTEKASLETWKQITRLLKRKFPHQIETVFLDGSGKPVPELTDRPVSKALAQKFFSAYDAFLREKKALPETVMAFMKNFAGRFIPVDHEASRLLYYASGPPKEWYVYFSDPHPEGMFFLFFKPAGSLEEMAMSDELRRLERVSPNLKLCLAVRGEKEEGLPEKLGIKPSGGRSLWKALQQAGNGRIWIDDVLVGYRPLSPRLWVIGSLTASEGNRSLQPTLPAPLVPSFALLAMLILGMTRLGSSETFFSSVRIKLLALFLYAALVPLIVMGVTAKKFLTERQVVLENETHSGVEKSIRAFDGGFKEFTEGLRDTIENHHFSGDLSSRDAFTDFQDRFDHYRKIYGFDICRIFDSSGKMVLSSYEPDAPTFFGGPLKFLTRMAHRAFRAFHPEMAAAHAGKPVAGTSPQKGSGGEFMDSLVPNLSPQSMQEIGMATWEFYIGTMPLGNALNQMTHYGFLIWFRAEMESAYVRRRLPVFSRNRDQGLFLAWNPDSREKIVPPISAKTAFVKPFLGSVSSSSSGFRKIIEWKGRPWLLTGLQGTRLKYTSVLCVTSYHKIQGELDRLRWHGGFISCAIMGMCFLITFLLARFIIEPLGNITQGIEAISRRDFQFQIPLMARDELGTLANVFNRTMEDMKDLEVARTIQESLFPKAPLTTGTWEIYGTCRPASQVGGDYFDYLPLEGDRALIIIGDVSGHGVGAALVVAMVKALVVQMAASPGKPEEILRALNQVLWGVLKRKKMMSCCLALFHGPTGTLELVNAGHCSPLAVAGTQGTYITMTAYPLGCSKNWKPSFGSITLGKRQAILFYSDGLIEALDGKGEPVGYERFASAIPQLIRGRATATEKAIRAWHDDLSRKNPPDDDISVIVVQENFSGSAPE